MSLIVRALGHGSRNGLVNTTARAARAIPLKSPPEAILIDYAKEHGQRLLHRQRDLIIESLTAFFESTRSLPLIETPS